METASSPPQLGSFAPHGQCLLWNSDLVWLHTISDSLTALAYYSIPIALLYFAKKRRDLPYKWIFVLFGAFIFACGTTHLMTVWTIWKPDYWLEGTIKGANAAISLITAGLLWPMMPRLLRLPSPAQLDAANQELQKEISIRRHVAAELAGIRQHLERQVQERTAELLQANTALHADIAERIRAENALREANAYNRSLIEASLDPLVTISPDGNITDVNTATEAVTGLPRERLIGSDFSDCFTEPDSAQEGYRQALSQGAVRDYPLTVRHTSGRLTDVLYNATVYCNTAGVVQGILATARDITERRRIQEQAARTERLATLGQLLGGIAHEIKNPLFVMTGRLQLLKEKLANREYDTLGTELQPIEDASRRMTEITQRFLVLARPLKPQWQRCWVHDVLTQTLDFLTNELMKNRIAVVRAFAPNLPQTWSEPRQLHEVFLNLIMNAMQAMAAAHGQGTLTITTDRQDDWIAVSIHDDGPGISPQHRARLFEPFFSTKPPDQGTGLGLWTVRSTLAGLQGTVDCESVEGKGTTFTVTIPLVAGPPQE